MKAERGDVHPSRPELYEYARLGPISDHLKRIADHIGGCEECRVIVDARQRLLEFEREADQESLAPEATDLANRLWNESIAGNVIEFRPLESESRQPAQWRLAADGTSEPGPRIENLATYFSDQPELILRVMRDNAVGREYLQVAAADPATVAHVMVRLPDQGLEFLTDANGESDLSDADLGRVDSLKWQVKMPDAVFELESLSFDPDRTEYESEMTLDSGRGDRICVTFEGKTAGRLIRIQVLELGGSADFGKLRVSVSSQSGSEIRTIEADRLASFVLHGTSETINIRLFD